LTMAEMGISSTNLLFNSELASEFLSDDILAILGDDPEKDSNIMHTRSKTTPQTSTIGESDHGGSKPLDLDADDDNQVGFYSGYDMSVLDHIQSASMRIIDRLPLFVHDLERWRNGFDVIKFNRAEHLDKRKRYAAAFNPEQVNQQTLKIITRRKPKPRRIPRKVRTHTNTLMA